MFDNFLKTNTYFTSEQFQTFGLEHVTILIMLIVLMVIVLFYFKKQIPEQQTILLKVIAWTIIILELLKDALFIQNNTLTLNELPFHLCGINIFVIIAHAYRPTTLKAEWLYAVCLPAALSALLFPNWTVLPIFSYLNIHNFLIHSLLVLYPLLLLASGFKLNYRNLGKCFIGILGVALVIYPMNKLLGTNYMFLNYAGTGNPLEILEKYLGNPGYILVLPFIFIVIWCILYGGSYLCDKVINIFLKNSLENK